MAKFTYIICLSLGSFLGSWIANLFGAGYFSAWGIVVSGAGAITGIYVAWKINNAAGGY